MNGTPQKIRPEREYLSKSFGTARRKHAIGVLAGIEKESEFVESNQSGS
jgi:hypothetical protein